MTANVEKGAQNTPLAIPLHMIDWKTASAISNCSTKRCIRTGLILSTCAAALLAEIGLTEVVQMLKVASGAELEHDKQGPPERYHGRLLGFQLRERPLRHLVQAEVTW